MDTGNANIVLTAVIGLITISIMLIAILVGWAQSVITTLTANEANKIANEAKNTAIKACELALYDHKLKIVPDLVGVLEMPLYLAIDTPDEDMIEVTFTNKKHTLCKITEIHWSGHRFRMKETQLKYPILLELNQKFTIGLTFAKGYRAHLINVANRHKSSQPNVDDVFADIVVPEHLRKERFSIDLEDEIGTQYVMNFAFDNEQNLFVGRTQVR
jgi:hypothetical protein